ncbi:ShlB/FhaC/HecB family hemolysin secretion/activation protein [Rhodoferax saidenbachensis]|nr:ShlB/FhaC/HecB family hemolysin secretion/activation protein [Rhodoferax saidenbachensis]
MKRPLQRTVAAWMAAAALQAMAQQQGVPAATGASTQFRISGFELTGDIPLSQDETTRILAPFIVPQASLDTLQKASAALEAALKAKGYALHRVSLPAQELGGKVTLAIVKFVIGKITLEGNANFSDTNVRASVPELREGETPNFKILAVQTAIANENPSKQVQVTVKESDEADKIDAKISIKDVRPWNASVNWANTGSNSTGNDRLTVALGHVNLLDRDHQLSVAYTTSLERSETVKQLGLNYRIPLYQQGGVVGVSYTNSDVIGNFGSFTSSGAGQTYGVNYSLYMPPEGGNRRYWTVSLDEKQFDASKINGVVIPGQSDRGSRPVTLGYTSRMESDTSIWSYNADVAFNLPGSSGNNLSAYKTEDARIGTVNWSVLHAGVSYLAPLPGGWLWSARAQVQYSGDALIAGEQFGLGGATSVRGTGERMISGDNGGIVNLEVSTFEFRPGLRLVGFVDAGWLNSNNTAAGTAGKLAMDQLASAGLGLRFNSPSFNLSAEWGHITSGATQPVGGNPALPKAGDEKLHVSVTARF